MWGWIGIIAKSWAEVEGEEKRRRGFTFMFNSLLVGWVDGRMDGGRR